MTVTKAYTVDIGIFDVLNSPPTLSPGDAQSKMFLVGNLCNHSHPDRTGVNVGQATEVALMNVLPIVRLRDQREVSTSDNLSDNWVKAHEPLASLQYFHRKSEVPFTSENKFQSVTGSFTNVSSDRETTYLSGALEAVLPRCRFYLRSDHTTAALDPNTAKIVLAQADSLAASGLRIVGMATGPDPDALIFVGFQGMMDPPRKGVASAISQLHAGGIQVVMITGDSELTALAIARELGIKVGGGAGGGKACMTGKEIDLLSQRQLSDRIGGVTVFARTTPRHKMAIIEAFQSKGAVVAMTGDGGTCDIFFEMIIRVGSDTDADLGRARSE